MEHFFPCSLIKSSGHPNRPRDPLLPKLEAEMKLFRTLMLDSSKFDPDTMAVLNGVSMLMEKLSSLSSQFI